MTKRKRQLGFAYDHERGDIPIVMNEGAVAAKVDEALEHPDSHIIAVVFVLHDELFVKIANEPSKAGLAVMEQATETYRKIIRGQ